jgi:hypothetical protein
VSAATQWNDQKNGNRQNEQKRGVIDAENRSVMVKVILPGEYDFMANKVGRGMGRNAEF